ncbi:hypothetical protein D3C86_1429450 [compost metagenome]
MLYRTGNALHHSNRNDCVEIFGAPVLFRCRHQTRHHITNGLRTAHFAASFDQGFDERLEMRGNGSGIHQQCLSRAANAGASHLGVDDDTFCHVEIGGFVDIDVADAFQMRKDRHAGFRLHPSHEALAAARHDDINSAVQAAEKRADGRTVGHRHQLNGMLGKTGNLQPLHEAGMNSTR